MNCKINNYIIDYEVIRKDNKNLYFRFDENCKLIITTPKYVTDDDVKNLISKNSSSICVISTDDTLILFISGILFIICLINHEKLVLVSGS